MDCAILLLQYLEFTVVQSYLKVVSTVIVLYPWINNNCRASTRFEEIQLAPNSIGISPLTLTSLKFFQQLPVRAFT